MSALVMGLVWELTETPEFGRAEKYILLAYADHADSNGKNIYPSVDLVGRKTFYEERSVQSITRKLEKIGYLKPDGVGPRGTNRFSIPIEHLPNGGAKIAPLQNAVQDFAPEGIAPEGIAPEPSVVVVINQIDRRFAEISKRLAELTGGALNTSSADLISTWIEKHTNEWIFKAIEIAQDKRAKSANYVDTVLINWEAKGYPRVVRKKYKERKMQTISNVIQQAQRPTSKSKPTPQSSQRSTDGAGSSNNESECPDCREIGWYRLDVEISHPQFGKYQRCGCKSANDLSRLQRLSGLTTSERVVRLTDIVSDDGSDTRRMVDAAKRFVHEPAGFLTIYGNTGNAKTAVMHGIVNELVNASVEAVYITAFDLISYIRSAFDKQREIVDATAYDRLKRLECVRVLCLDELDKVKWSDWVEEQITDLIDARYRLGLDWEVGTVVAMNAAPSTLPAWIYSRLRDGRNVMIENKDADVRPGMEN